MWRFPKLLWLCLPLLLAACGGSGGGGGGGDRNRNTAVFTDAPPFEDPVARPDLIPAGDLSISGTILVSPAVAVDRDTRDPFQAQSSLPSNNLPFDNGSGLPKGGEPTFEEFAAQLIPSPGIVGGFLAVETYRDGFPFGGDLHDFYRAYLAAGQVVSLQISDFKNSNPFANDFDLLLLDLEGNLRASSAGLGPIETLQAPDEAGEYLLVVTICADRLFRAPTFICGDGRSNYTLTLGQTQAGFVTGGLNVADDFILHEALVEFHDQPLVNPEQQIIAQASSLRVDDSRVGDIHRIAFEPDIPFVQSSALQIEETTDSSEASDEQQEFFISVTPEQEEKLATLSEIKAMHHDANVAWAEPNFLRETFFEPDDLGYQFQWHYPFINLPAAWDQATGANVTVAVLDTGILPFHPDIQNQLDLVTGGYDFVSSTFYSLDGDAEDGDPTDPGDGLFLGNSSSFHGTHVAGTIAAEINNIDLLTNPNGGVAGVAFNSRILPVRVLGRGVGTSFDIARGLCFAAGLTNGICEGVPDNPNPADIINLSLGGTGSSLTEQQLFDEITAEGILVVAAAGNSSSPRPFYPAAYDGVFSVSALNISSTLASYSNFGDSIDLAAPGGEFGTDVNDDGFVDGVLSIGGNDALGTVEYVFPFFQGTSMAAPHVAGVFALMRSVNSELDTPAIEQLLRNGDLTEPLDGQVPGQRTSQYGYGRIDAAKAVSTAVNLGGLAPDPVPWLAAIPNSLNFGATFDTVNFDLRNNSAGLLDIINIESDQGWLLAPAIDDLGNYELEVDRDGLPEGIYQGALTVEATSNTVIIDVLMQVNDDLEFGDAGHIYVRLIDADTGNIREVEVDVIDGEYSYNFDDLPSGNYQLVAFSDADFDGRICDVGEACGVYPTIDQAVTIDLQADQDFLDFSLSYLNVGVELGSLIGDSR